MSDILKGSNILITRYEGKRFITEAEIDAEFTGCYVLIDTIDFPNERAGYLVASGDGSDEALEALDDLADAELKAANIIYGCKTRGGSLHVQLLG